MQQLDAKALFQKYQAGQCSPEEQAVVENWLTFGEAGKLNLTEQELDEDLLELRQRAARVTRGRIVIWPRVIGAAAAVAAIVFGIWFYNARHPGGSEATRDLLNYAKNDIAPGKNGATITLANGKVIALSDAKSGVVVGGEKGLVYDDNTSVISSAARDLLNSTDKGSLLRRDDGQGVDGKGGEAGAGAQTLTASTTKGQTYQFTLPDGTKVWLNADSKISFPSQFSEKERKILLSGEGYFEVAKDKAHPFLVKTKNQDVTVLGTHFNVNGYDDERVTTTTLVEGSVRVSSFDVALGQRTEVLKPNQQSIQNQSGGMQVRNVDVSEALDWKNGEFIFKREPLQNIMRRVSRWYDVQIIYENGVDVNETFSGVVSRKKHISEVLNLMGLNGQLKFKIEGKKVYVGK